MLSAGALTALTVLLGALLFFILLWGAVCLSILLFQLNDPITM